jgi:hypothetical protein
MCYLANTDITLNSEVRIQADLDKRLGLNIPCRALSAAQCTTIGTNFSTMGISFVLSPATI